MTDKGILMLLKTSTISITFLLTFILTIVFTEFAQSAQISDEKDHRDEPIIFVDGQIATGDYDKIKTIAREFVERGEEVRLLINSSGGNLFEALKIGEFVNQIYATVTIKGDQISPNKGKLKKCYSACVIIWISAFKRDHVQDNEFFTSEGQIVWETIEGKENIKSVPLIGIHRPYIDPEVYGEMSLNEAEKTYSRLEKLVNAHLSAMGVPETFINRMFRIPSQKIELIPKTDFIDIFGYERPFLEEWFSAKCGVLDAAELNDLVQLSADRIISGNSDLVPTGMTKGYVSYLIKKQNEIDNCKTQSLLDHQRSVLN